MDASLWQKAVIGIDPVPENWRTVVANINGEAALVAYHLGQMDRVWVFSTDAERITAIRAVRNPDKLAWLGAHADLAGER